MSFRKAPPPPRRDRTGEFDSLVIDRPRAVLRRVDGPDRLYITVPKDEPARCEAYRRLVAAMPCAHCGRIGMSQCAHTDNGKGLAIKADDRETYPACADAPGRRGCHSIIGASGLFTRDQRRALESKYARQTRSAILADGAWPKSLPLWVEAQ